MCYKHCHDSPKWDFQHLTGFVYEPLFTFLYIYALGNTRYNDDIKLNYIIKHDMIYLTNKRRIFIDGAIFL